MRCAICKREDEEVQLFEGVLDSEMIMCCNICSEKENIPLIRRPSTNQIEKSKESYSVRERMEKISGIRKATPISEEQIVVQNNLAKLKVPDRKEVHPDIIDDYYWKVNIGRRRKKITISQMAEQSGIDASVISSIEKGKIPTDFMGIFMRLERFLGIKLLKVRPQKITLTRTINDEKEILKKVKQRMDGKEPDDEEREEKVERIKEDKFDFSKRENLQNITLNDLVDLKRKREKEKRKVEEKSRSETLMGDDIEIDLDEL